MRSCWAPNCSSRKGVTNEKIDDNVYISFHLFPKDPVLQQKWIEATMKVARLSKNTCLCSNHFTADCFKMCRGIRTLKAGSIPTIFSWTFNVQQSTIDNAKKNVEDEKCDSVVTEITSAVESNPSIFNNLMTEQASRCVTKTNNAPTVTNVLPKIQPLCTVSQTGEVAANAMKTHACLLTSTTLVPPITEIFSRHSHCEIADFSEYISDNNESIDSDWSVDKPVAAPCVYNLGTEHNYASQCVASTSQTQNFDTDSTYLSSHIQNNKPDICTKRKLYNPRFLKQYSLEHLESPRKRQKFYTQAMECIQMYQKKINVLQQEKLRLRKRVENLQATILDLRHEKNSLDPAETLMASLSTQQKQIFERQLQGKCEAIYPPELRNFALTLYFYSSKAYEYVRKVFNNNLPHPTTLKKWYQCEIPQELSSDTADYVEEFVIENENENLEQCISMDEIPP